ncbi:hypothetical protein ACFLQN_04190 [Candidatus Aenigmatarchaeota archaeon]
MAGSIVEILQMLSVQTAAFVPNLIGAIILLVIGLVVGKILGRVIKEILTRVRLDYYVTEKEKPVISISGIFSLITRWWIYLAFIAAAVETLGITALTMWVTRTVNFIPNIIGATVILVAGYLLAEYIKVHMNKLKSIHAALVGKVLFFFIIYVAIAIALPILGISATLVNNILLVIIGSIGLGMAIAIGLGGKDAVSDISKRWVKKVKI